MEKKNIQIKLLPNKYASTNPPPLALSFRVCNPRSSPIRVVSCDEDTRIEKEALTDRVTAG